MKRSVAIAKLADIGYSSKKLGLLSNAQIGDIFKANQPRLERRAARLRRAEEERVSIEMERRKHIERLLKMEDAVREAEEDSARQAAWMRRCVKVPFPPIVAHYPPPVLDFGLASFIAFCIGKVRQEGSEDAACTLRVLLTGRWGAR